MPVLAHPTLLDPRLRTGAYISCGEPGHRALHYVLGTHTEHPKGKASFDTLTCEDCAKPDTMAFGISTVQLGIDAVKRDCTLVRCAPGTRPPAQGYQAPDGA